ARRARAGRAEDGFGDGVAVAGGFSAAGVLAGSGTAAFFWAAGGSGVGVGVGGVTGRGATALAGLSPAGGAVVLPPAAPSRGDGGGTGWAICLREYSAVGRAVRVGPGGG